MQCCLVFFREEARNRRAHLISLNAVSFYYVTYIISENCSAVKFLFKYIIQQFRKVFSSYVSGLQLSWEMLKISDVFEVYSQNDTDLKQMPPVWAT